MGNHYKSKRTIRNARDEQTNKAVSEAMPDEARMSEIAKRLLSTLPEKRNGSHTSSLTS